MMKVKITSPCMAMLYYEAAKSPCQTEGSIFGEKATETTRQITDSNVTLVTEDVLSVHALGSMWNSDPVSDKQEISHIPVGWYKVCRRPTLNLTVREKSVHRKLVKHALENGGCPSHVITLLIHELWAEQQSAYIWRCAAFAVNEGKFTPVQLEIVNLKATTCGSYKPYPSVHQQQRLPEVSAALTRLESSFTTTQENASFQIAEVTRQTSCEIMEALEECAGTLRQTEKLLESAHAEKLKLEQRLQELRDKKTVEKTPEAPTEIEVIYDDDTTDSSDSDVSDDETKVADLGQDVEGEDRAPAACEVSETNTDVNGHAEPRATNSDLGVKSSPDENTPPAPVDPFDSLVNLAKADLAKSDVKKTPVQNSSVPSGAPCANGDLPATEFDAEQVARYNDEKPWGEKTRSGRLKNASE